MTREHFKLYAAYPNLRLRHRPCNSSQRSVDDRVRIDRANRKLNGRTCCWACIYRVGLESVLVRAPAHTGDDTVTQVATHCPDTLQPEVAERRSTAGRGVADPTRVLIIEDDAASIDWMTELLEERGYAIKAARDGRTAEAIRDAWHPHLVLMDFKLPDTDATKLLPRFRGAAPETEIVIITGYGSVTTAVDAMRQGAFSFIEKPVGPEVLTAVIEKALERSAMTQENRRLRERLKSPTGFANIVAASDRMHELFHVMRLAAPTDANILIHGESGTGKELVASAIHLHSTRANGPFISINCAAVPADLI
ncbi:MAG TPA: response regulator [Vicinamibacterales bacterium]|nr:response regulator [Vicinamibacterales bacterium]